MSWWVRRVSAKKVHPQLWALSTLKIQRDSWPPKPGHGPAPACVGAEVEEVVVCVATVEVVDARVGVVCEGAPVPLADFPGSSPFVAPAPPAVWV